MARTVLLFALALVVGCRVSSAPTSATERPEVLPEEDHAETQRSETQRAETEQPEAEHPETEQPETPPTELEPAVQADEPRVERGTQAGPIGLESSCKVAACSRPRKWRTKIRAGELTIIGGELDDETVWRLLHTTESMLHLCYQNALEKEPELAGTVELHLVVAPTRDGHPTRVHVAEGTGGSSPELADVEACFVRIVRRINFPAPGGQREADVTFDLRLSPDGHGPPTMSR